MTSAPTSLPHLSAPTWRREPYRLLFPLGALLGAAGVLPWLLFGVGASTHYRSLFHAQVQVQGFLACFVLGFLFTFVPRRTGTPAPAAWEMGLALLAPVGLAVAAWAEQVMLAQACWWGLLAMLLHFVVRRALGPHRERQVPGGFAWLPAALLMGLVGSLLTAAPALLAAADVRWHVLGQGLLTQGLVAGLVLGVGTLLLNTVLYGRPGTPPDDVLKGASGALHLGAAALFAASFWVEAFRSPQLGFALRALVALAMLLGPMRLWRPPTEPGVHRRLVWVAAWMVPAGFLLMALFPAHRVAAAHVVFIGAFTLITLCISLHVVLAHGGHGGLLRTSPWQVAGLGAFTVAGLVFRGLMSLDPAHLHGWMAAGALCLLGALALWATLVVPRLGLAPTASR